MDEHAEAGVLPPLATLGGEVEWYGHGR